MKPLISLEDYVSSTGVDNVGENAAEHVADVENAHLELCEKDREVEQISNALLEGCQHYCTLRDVEAGLLKEDVYQEPVAKAMLMAMEHMLSQLGRPKDGKLSLESLSGTIQDVWEKLLEAFKRAWAHFKKWLDALFDTCKRLEKRAERLKKDLANYGDSGKNTPLTNSRLLNFIGDRTGHADGLKVAIDISETVATVSTIYVSMVKHMGQIHTAIRGMITLYHRTAKQEPEAAEATWKKFQADSLLHLYYDPAMYKSFGAKKSDAPGLKIEHTVLYTVPFPVGNAQFFARLADSPSITAEHFGSIAHHCGFGVGPLASKHHPDSVDPLPHRLITTALDDVVRLTQFIGKTRDEGKKTISDFERLLRDIKSGMTAEGVNPTFDAQLIKTLAQSTTGLLNMTISGERSMRMYQVKIAKQLLDWCALSMAQLPKIKGNKSIL